MIHGPQFVHRKTFLSSSLQCRREFVNGKHMILLYVNTKYLHAIGPNRVTCHSPICIVAHAGNTEWPTLKSSQLFLFKWFLLAKAAMLSARLSHRNSVRPSVCHTGGSGKNGPS